MDAGRQPNYAPKVARSSGSTAWLAPIAVMVAVLAGSAGFAFAAASGTVVSLRTTAGYLTRNVALCAASDRKPYVYFHRQTPIVFVGSVRARPTAKNWHVTVRVKRCVGKTFRTVKDIRVNGRSDGSFRAAYRPGLAGVYWARAYYPERGGQVKSAKRWLVVR